MNRYKLSTNINPQDPLVQNYGTFISQLLVNRNISDIESAKSFLEPKWSDTHDPFLLDDMETAIERIYMAIKKKEKITIYADYDADGVPGAIVLADLFDAINYAHYDIYIPHRHHEGYGINTASLEKIKKTGTNLIISIDVGITEHTAAEWTKKNDIDLIITDHHTPLMDTTKEQNIPKALAVINPKKDTCSYPDPMICGCAVIFKVVQGFIKKHGKEFPLYEGWEKWLLDMVGISTISDMVPLRHENRIFAHYGLRVIKKIAHHPTKRPGLQKLIQEARIYSQHLTEDDIAFNITPKINAASRMSHPQDAIAVFHTQDTHQAQNAMRHLVQLNNKRKKLTRQMTHEAMTLIQDTENPSVIVVGKENWSAGILGLVASKLVERYHVPVFTWSREGDIIIGSARSLDGFHLVEIMQLCSKKTFIGFGGHAEAGGFRCTPAEIQKLEKRLIRAMKKFKKENPERKTDKISIDMELSIDDINQNLYTKIRQLAPFGIGNPKPLFLLKNVKIEKIQTFGKEQNHLELFIKNSFGKTIRALRFFKTPKDFPTLQKDQLADILVHLEYSVFMGKHELRLQLVDVFNDIQKK